MRRLLILIPLCALLVSPAADKDSDKTIPLDIKPFVDDGADLPNASGLEKLAGKDPVAFLENCLRRYQREVTGYTCTMQKQERVGDKLQPKEVIAVTYREKPIGVLLRWQDGQRMAESALYVEGDNKEKDGTGTLKSFMLVHPAGLVGKLRPLVSIDPEGKEAGQSGRYAMPEFGIEKGTQRTLSSWKAAQAKKQLNVEYVGEVKLPEAGDRACYKLRRPNYPKPEEDGVTDLTIYIDKETWLQVGSVLKADKVQYIAQYYFRDIKLNPELKPEALSREALMK
jgi:hypothetical protein